MRILFSIALAACAIQAAAAQTLVADLWLGPGSSHVTPMGEAGGRLVFSAYTEDGFGLFSTDGSSVARLASGDRIQYNGAETSSGLYLFLREDSTSTTDLWRTDGTLGGTMRVAQLPPSDRLGYPVLANDRLFFLLRPAFTPDVGRPGTQLWTSDGSAQGTREVDGAAPRVNDGLAYVVTAAGGRVYYSSGGGTELASSDGFDVSAPITFATASGSVGRGGGFFYGTALGVGDRVFALTVESDPIGLFTLDDTSGPTLVEQVFSRGTTNQTLVAFGDGVLFEGRDISAPDPLAYYAIQGGSLARVSPMVGYSRSFSDLSAVSPLADGSVALALQMDEGVEIWRIAPGESFAARAFALPQGEKPFSRFGLYEVARENRSAPAAVVADGTLHVLTSAFSQDDQGDTQATYSLLQDAGDGTARLLARYEPRNPNTAPSFATAGGKVYVAFSTPETGYELFALGSTSTGTESAYELPSVALTLRSATPTTGIAKLGLSAPSGEHVRVEAFDGIGRRVALVYDGIGGEHAVTFDASDMGPGVYFVRATSGRSVATQSVVVLR